MQCYLFEARDEDTFETRASLMTMGMGLGADPCECGSSSACQLACVIAQQLHRRQSMGMQLQYIQAMHVG